jgi:hypothetical protein
VFSGVVELAFGTALVSTWKQPRRAVVGAAAAALFVAAFPGNVAQLTGHRDAFGLDTDTKRAIRLLFQPLLVAWALGATDARRTPHAHRELIVAASPAPLEPRPGPASPVGVAPASVRGPALPARHDVRRGPWVGLSAHGR